MNDGFRRAVKAAAQAVRIRRWEPSHDLLRFKQCKSFLLGTAGCKLLQDFPRFFAIGQADGPLMFEPESRLRRKLLPTLDPEQRLLAFWADHTADRPQC